MERRSIVVSGIVQGVGFRPFVYGLASRMGLSGFVKNQSSGVLIEIEGETPALDDFLVDIASRPPPLAQIGQLHWERRTPTGDYRFRIEPSEDDASRQIFISPDVSPCRDCLAEIVDPEDRRYRYPFLNCTQLRAAADDHHGRSATTASARPWPRSPCAPPAGPSTRTPPTAGSTPSPPPARPAARGSRSSTRAASRSRPATRSDGSRPRSSAGRIGALKGLGGYHLACDARSQAAVAELRRRKHRDEKPFAVMVADVAGGGGHLRGAAGRARVAADRGRARSSCCASGSPRSWPTQVAPGNPCLGVMLPYTPLHHLLLRGRGRDAAGDDQRQPSDEPIAYDDDEAVSQPGRHRRPVPDARPARSTSAATTR